MKILSDLQLMVECERECFAEDMERGEKVIHASVPEHLRVIRATNPSDPHEPLAKLKATPQEILDALAERQPLTEEESLAIWHESGHNIVANYFGLLDEAARTDTAIATAPHRGMAITKRGNPFQESAIGWAGIITTAMAGLDDPEVPVKVKLTLENARDWFNQFIAANGLEKQSKEDRMAIKTFALPAAEPDLAFNPFRQAVSILTDDWALVEFQVDKMKKDCTPIIQRNRIDPTVAERAAEAFEKTRSIKAALITARSKKGYYEALEDHFAAEVAAEAETARQRQAMLDEIAEARFQKACDAGEVFIVHATIPKHLR